MPAPFSLALSHRLVERAEGPIASHRARLRRIIIACACTAPLGAILAALTQGTSRLGICAVAVAGGIAALTLDLRRCEWDNLSSPAIARMFLRLAPTIPATDLCSTSARNLFADKWVARQLSGEQRDMFWTLAPDTYAPAGDLVAGVSLLCAPVPSGR